MVSARSRQDESSYTAVRVWSFRLLERGLHKVYTNFSRIRKNLGSLGTASIFKEKEALVQVLPIPESPQMKDFKWQYRGRTYSLEATLYDSFYRFYRDLPTGVPLASEAGQDPFS